MREDHRRLNYRNREYEEWSERRPAIEHGLIMHEVIVDRDGADKDDEEAPMTCNISATARKIMAIHPVRTGSPMPASVRIF